MDPVIVEVRGGREEVDPVMGVRGGQRGGGPCYGGSEAGSEDVDSVIVEVKRGTEKVDPVIVEVRGGTEEVDPVSVEVRGGTEWVDPLMGGQRVAARMCTLLRGV